MESKNLQQGSGELRQSEVVIPKIIIERQDEKIDVEIREIIRVRPQDFSALKNSFEEWSKTWE